MRRGAPLRVVSDQTSLNGARIDVSARIGWTLRMARFLAPETPSMRQVAGALGLGMTMLHRVETGIVRSGAMCDRYEQALGMPSGSLRAPVDIVCRGFSYSPPDRNPGPTATTVAQMSALTEAVGDESPGGGDWLTWARSLSRPGAGGLPTWLATMLIDRLVRELNRSVGAAYPSRYEALALLRCGPYGQVVLDVARQRVADPHVQVLFDMMSAVGELAEPEATAWCMELLSDPRDRVVTGAVLALENMSETNADPDFWIPLVTPLLEVYEQTADRDVAWRWVSHLLRLIPNAQLRAAGKRPVRPLAPTAQTGRRTTEEPQGHWHDAQRMAHAVTDKLDIPDQPMLARMLYEIAFGPLETRAVPSYMLLSALAPLAPIAAEQITVVVDTHEDPVIRDRASRRLAGLVHGPAPAAVVRWLNADSLSMRSLSLRLAGAAGLDVPRSVLSRAVDEGNAATALYAAGMTAHGFLADMVADAGASAEVRGAARWWAAEGTRVSDA